MRLTDYCYNVWLLLCYFWSDERVKRWEQALLLNSGVHQDICSNMMCLFANAHRYYREALFVLKPISLRGDKKELVFWLRRGEQNPDSIAVRPSLRISSISGPEKAGLTDYRFPRDEQTLTRCLICSGDEIVMTTDDPVNRPLPNFDILEMQWFLQRVSAIAGATEVYNDFDGDDCDDDDSYKEFYDLEILSDAPSDDKT